MPSFRLPALLSLVSSADVLGKSTFGMSFKTYKDGKNWPTQQEISVFNHSCEASVCSMHHFWAGGSFPGYEDSTLRYYVDGESEASVVIPFALGLGSDMLGKHLEAPWSAGGLFGQTGAPSGIFHNYMVPFGKSMRVTVELGGSGSQKFWIILKGTTGLVPKIGGESLPVSARAKTFQQVEQQVEANARIPLVNSSAANGAVLASTLFVDASGASSDGSWKVFLEGCIRAEATDGTVRSLYSSGTEDYFLGTYYFNRGMYANPVAGLTDMDDNAKTFSAYRIHDADPLYFEDGLALTWRNSDPEECILDQGRSGAFDVTASSFAFAYEWPSTDVVV